MYLEELAADLDGRRSDGQPGIDEHDDAQMRAGLPDPAEGQSTDGPSQRPDWLTFKIKETQFGTREIAE